MYCIIPKSKTKPIVASHERTSLRSRQQRPLSGLQGVKAVRNAERGYRPIKSRMNDMEKSIYIAVTRESRSVEVSEARGEG